jgi:hypothetical protein
MKDRVKVIVDGANTRIMITCVCSPFLFTTKRAGRDTSDVREVGSRDKLVRVVKRQKTKKKKHTPNDDTKANEKKGEDSEGLRRKGVIRGV